MSRSAKILIGVVVTFLLLPILLVVAILLPVPRAHSAPLARDAHPAYDCATHHWKRDIGVTVLPGWLGQFRETAHVCWWEQTASGHVKGQIVKRSIETKIRYDLGSGADMAGFDTWLHHKYNVVHEGGGWGTAQGAWSEWRICQHPLGIPLCDPTGNYVPVWKFISPVLINHSDGSLKKWTFFVHLGKPGEDPNNVDGHLKVG